MLEVSCKPSLKLLPDFVWLRMAFLFLPWHFGAFRWLRTLGDSRLQLLDVLEGSRECVLTAGQFAMGLVHSLQSIIPFVGNY